MVFEYLLVFFSTISLLAKNLIFLELKSSFGIFLAIFNDKTLLLSSFKFTVGTYGNLTFLFTQRHLQRKKFLENFSHFHGFMAETFWKIAISAVFRKRISLKTGPIMPLRPPYLSSWNCSQFFSTQSFCFFFSVLAELSYFFWILNFPNFRNKWCFLTVSQVTVRKQEGQYFLQFQPICSRNFFRQSKKAFKFFSPKQRRKLDIFTAKLVTS